MTDDASEEAWLGGEAWLIYGEDASFDGDENLHDVEQASLDGEEAWVISGQDSSSSLCEEDASLQDDEEEESLNEEEVLPDEKDNLQRKTKFWALFFVALIVVHCVSKFFPEGRFLPHLYTGYRHSYYSLPHHCKSDTVLEVQG